MAIRSGLRTRERPGYLPSLDGWRALAILAVLWNHDEDFHRWAGGRAASYQRFGGYGVQLFFAISGVLIAWRILLDEREAGHFRIKAFYVRRFFRIQPPQWVYLAVLALLMGLHVVHITWKYWFSALFLYINYLWHDVVNVPTVVAHSFLIGHFWTLAVEEHFYLLISVFFLVVKRRRAWTLGVLLLVLFAVQDFGHARLYSVDVSGRRTFWNIQYLLFASLVSILLQRPAFLKAVVEWWRPWVAFCFTGLVLVVHHVTVAGVRHITPFSVLQQDAPVLFLCFTGWVVATMLHAESMTTRVLELRPLRFVGRISYSLYIWHVLFYTLTRPDWCAWPWLVRVDTGLWKYVCTLSAAMLSYYCVEKPMIRRGHRMTRPPLPDIAASREEIALYESAATAPNQV